MVDSFNEVFTNKWSEMKHNSNVEILSEKINTSSTPTNDNCPMSLDFNNQK